MRWNPAQTDLLVPRICAMLATLAAARAAGNPKLMPKRVPMTAAEVHAAAARLARYVNIDEPLAAKLAAVPEHITEVRLRISDGEVTWVEPPAAAGESIDITGDAPPALVVDSERRLFWLQQVTRVKAEAAA